MTTGDDWLRSIIRPDQPTPAPPPKPRIPRAPQGTRGRPGSPIPSPPPGDTDTLLRDFLDEHRGHGWHRFEPELGPRP